MSNNIISNAVIYTRFSSHKQDAQSTEGQLRDCYAFAKRKGLTVIEEYSDEETTGTNDRRSEFQRMLKDAKKQQFSYVIIWSLDRFARNVYDSVVNERTLEDLGIEVLTAAEDFGTGANADLMKNIKRSIAEHYSKDLAKKTKRGMRESVIKGQCIGGHALYGYKFVDKKIVIDEEKAAVIKYVFEEYAKGRKKREIFKELNDRGVRNAAGNPLSSTSFQSALKNRKYTGIFTFKGVDYANVYPAIVSVSTFEKVQQRLKARAIAPAENSGKIEYALHGKVFCGVCGENMIGDSAYNTYKRRYDYYTCAAKKRKLSCIKKREDKDGLEWYVVEKTISYVLVPDRMNYIADMVIESYKDTSIVSKEVALQRQIAKIDKNIDKCFNLIIEDDNPEIVQRAKNRSTQLNDQKADLELTLSRLRLANGLQFTKDEILALLRSFCGGDITDADFRQRIIDTFVNAVHVYDDKVFIYYNLDDSELITPKQHKENLEKKKNGRKNSTLATHGEPQSDLLNSELRFCI